MNLRNALRALLVLAAVCFAAPSFAQHRLVTGGAKKAPFRMDASPMVMRERAVNVDLPALARAAADRSPYIEIAFFDDAVYQVYLKGSEPTHSGGVAYYGYVPTSPMFPVVLVDNGGTLVVLFASEGRRFSMQGSEASGFVTRELVAADRPDHSPSFAVPPIPSYTLPGVSDPNLPTYNPPVVATPDSNNVIDVMVMYTPAAATANGGTALMNANVDAQITLTNQIYANSLATQTIRLVYKGQVTYTEVNMDVDLPRAQDGSDGFMDELPILRNVYGADFVSLWGVYSDYCGLGSLMGVERNSFESAAYNVVASPACTGAGSYTFAHELGHNMGLLHDNYVSPGTTTVSPLGAPVDPGTTSIQYAHGYIDLTNRFRTVMSYNDQCAAGGFNCTRIPYFSNPAISFNNNASYGSAVLAATGNATNAHEQRALNDTLETTQNFRQAITLGGAGVVAAVPASYTVAEGAGTVTIRVSRHVGSVGAISVNYATVAGTASAASDYTHTSGTLNWAAGESGEKTFNVTILQDSVLEGNETFTVLLNGATGGASVGSSGGTSQSATIRITDDEPDTFPKTSLLPGGYVSPNVPTPNSPSSNWAVNAADGFSSNSSLQSAAMRSNDGDFTNYVNSDLEFTGVFLAGNVNFAYKVSSYPNYQYFEFMIDGVVVVSNAGGEVAWTPVSQAITAGIHTLRWRFKSKLPFPCANTIPAPPGGANCTGRAYVDGVVLPLAAKFDFSGEGRADLAWAHTDGRQALWLMNGAAPTATQEMIGAGSGWSIVHVADLNGDTKGDLVWEHTDGRMAVYTMNGTVPTATQQLLNAGAWRVSHTGDLNGDGKHDLVFKNSDGSVAVWLMNGTAMTSGATLMGPGTGWSVSRVADFDGDGKADVFWVHTDGRAAIWLMNGTAVASTAQILNAASGWSPTHVGDFDGDGRADILWTHTDGSIAIWLMNGTAMASGSGILGAGTGWSVNKVGDFNGDGRSDLYFQHTDGRAAIYLMNGLAPTQTAQILNAGGGWSARRLADLNGDGKADIVWQHTDGSTAIWLMNGTAMSSGTGVLGAGTGWSVSPISQ